MRIKLLSDRILVKPIKAEQRTSFGIILPEHQQNNDLGVVVSVGPKVKEIKIGDKIQKYKQVHGVPYNEEGEDYIILREGSEVELVIQ